MLIKGSQKGQSLIEVLIVLAVSAVVILALVVASLMGLKNAQLAQNQSKATKHAQDAMDIIKTIRDRNGIVQFTYDQYNTTSKFSDLWTIEMSQKCASVTSRPCYFNLNTSVPSLSGSAGVISAGNDIGDGFTRQITLEDGATGYAPDYTKEKRVTVTIIWKDSNGSHQSQVQTILTNH